MMTLQTDMPVLQAQHQLAAAQIRAAEAVTQIGLHRIDREKRATHGFAAKQDSLASDCNGNVPRTGAPVDGAAVRNKRELRVFIIFKCCGYCLECFPVLLMMASLMLHGIMQQFIGGFHPGVGAVHWEREGETAAVFLLLMQNPAMIKAMPSPQQSRKKIWGASV